MSVEVNLSGLDELTKKLEEVGKQAGKIENNALRIGAEIVLKEALANVPIDTGKLKDTLDVGKVKTKDGSKYIEVGITKGDNSEIFYGKFIEWGTSQRPATPFLQPAYESKKSEVLEAIKEELKVGLGL